MSRRALVILLLAVVVAVGLSPLSSSLPDGLETVAARLGFDHHAAPVVHPPLADYGAALPAPEPVRSGIAGLTGTTLVFLLAAGAAWVLRRRRTDARPGTREL
jgi:hypothetical protein